MDVEELRVIPSAHTPEELEEIKKRTQRVIIGKYAIVGAASVVTHDIPDYAVVVGSPAKIIKMLEPNRFDD